MVTTIITRHHKISNAEMAQDKLGPAEPSKNVLSKAGFELNEQLARFVIGLRVQKLGRATLMMI